MKLLSEFRYRSTPKYRGVLSGNLMLDLEMGYKGTHHYSHKETLLGVQVDDLLTICEGYASDLCSPGFYLLGRWYGTPALGPKIPPFVHDFARQFMRENLPCSPWDRKGSDDLFYNAMVMTRHPLRGTYHGAVSGRIGDLWMRLNRPRPDVSCACHADPLEAIEQWTGHKAHP